MRLMAIDPGAKRMGWAVINKEKGETHLVDSGIIGIDRKSNESYQKYKLKVIEYYNVKAKELLAWHRPDVLIAEIVPIQGFHNAAQSLLAATAATVFMSVAVNFNIEIKQVAAISVKKKITGNRSATKVAIRNKVIELYPKLNARKAEFKTIFDETDAIAIAHVAHSL